MKKILFMILGCFGVGMGAVGALIPVLPTFPFLMLAAIVISFATGLFGMILDHVPVVLIFHRGISIVMVSFLAIHIYVFHKKLKSL